MTLSAARPRAETPRASRASVFRDPNGADPALMTRRAWWLLVLHVLVPGTAQALAGNRRLGRFALGVWLLGLVAALLAAGLFVVLPQVPMSVPTNAVGLTVLQGVVLAWAVLWIVLTLDTLRLVRLVTVRPGSRIAVAGLLVVALVAGTGAAVQGAVVAGQAKDALGSLFAGTRYAMPVDGRYNILLLGGDAGPGRSGLRPDSISVVSVNALTGHMAMFGLPRDLDQMPFAAGSPMLKAYPHGYGWHDTCNVDVCELNSIYTEVQLKSPQLYPDAKAQHTQPGIEATKEAVEGSLGIPIQYSVLVDMSAFGALIDAMGGVTIDVKERLPIGGGVDANGNPTGVKVWIEKGVQHMNGNRAMWYARSRHGTSDYDRMARQRELETAMLHQMSPVTLLTRLEAIGKAGSAAVTTDIPQGLLGELAGVAVKARGQKTTTVEFVPPRVKDPSAPDYPAIRATVRSALKAAG
ncbi:LCP family protein [Amnibacterium sp.]|uniref:LCP family protein n=1 Tax=Amnibacterium sp. TaxID=1872496 RepID=UPI0026224428|nr:LCP family protein [Amnibacterium sp.]MCU1473863.1 LytR family transcriptional regulator [Amnibacterium sp.]